MSVFQIMAVVTLLVLASITLKGAIKGQMRKRIAVFWMLVWGGSAFVLFRPDTTVRIARFIGIGRGADLVFYCAVFAGLIGFFYVYIRFRRTDRQITLLVRKLALENPRQPNNP